MPFPQPTAPPVFAVAPQRILIIKPSAIGDVVHGLPVLNLLRRRWPEACISWLVTPACAGILQGHPQLDEIILFDRRRFGRAWKSLSAARDLLRFCIGLRRRKFDLVIDLQGLFRSGLLTAITAAPVRVGSTFSREFAWLFCTHRAPIDRLPRHAARRYLMMAAFMGLGEAPVEFHFAATDADREYIRNLLPEQVPYAVILPAANWATKRWPTGHFADLVKPLQEKFGLITVLAGAPDAAELAPLLPGVINLAGQTTLNQLVALLERASVVIANDTGPMHIAAALNRPLVTVFGPTSAVQTGPFERLNTVVSLDIECRPCFSRRCSHQTCLVKLGADPVIALVGEMVG